jgi:peptidylprolyl isomerase
MKIAIIIIIIACVAYYFYSSANNQKNAVINHEQGSAFLADNAQKEGVKTTASGLQYLVLQQGNGDRHPTASSTVRVHYQGTLINGTVFDSSVERGETISFPLNRVIPGWTEGVQLMKVGDKFRFFIPSGLGYGNRSTGKIPAGSVLIFDVELFEIQ